LLADGLVDEEFARSAVVDFDTYTELVAPWEPERVGAICGVRPDIVVRIAREFGEARPATIRCGIAAQQTRNGETFVRSLAALAIIGGHWRYRGGGLFVEANPVLSEQLAARPDLAPRKTRSLDMARLGEHLTSTSLEPPIRGLMVWTHNPAVTQPDAVRVREGLSREDLFTVVIEHFLTDTARYADVVLPSTTQLEHFDIVGAWGHHYISVNEAAVPPQGEAVSHGEIMRRLALRLGLDHPAFRETDEEIASAALPDAVSLDMLRKQGWYKTSPEPPTFGSGGPKLSIASEVTVPAVPAPGMLQLLTPKSHYFLNSSFGNMPRQRKAMKRPTLDMSTADAKTLGLNDGEEVEIANERAAIRAWLRVSDDVCSGVVALAGKWWGRSEDGSAVANLLTASSWSPGGQPAYNETFVRVTGVPVQEGAQAQTIPV
jgi:anaerobic selenocysteine-containing dehydrogenase